MTLEYTENVRPNEATPETQKKVREIILTALEMQKQFWFKDVKIKNEPAVIDILAYMHDNISGTKRVLYSLSEYVGDNYSALYHIAHAKPLHNKVISFLKKELKFLAPEEIKEQK